MLGHASAAMTLDTYADLFADDLDEVGARLDQAASRASVGKGVGRDESEPVSAFAKTGSDLR
jgi:hypothetical protein